MLISPLKSILNVCVHQGKIQYPKTLLALIINIRKKMSKFYLNEYKKL